MAYVVSDLLALVRCLRMATALPGALAVAYREADHFVATFQRVVAPIVDRTVRDTGTRAHVRHALGAGSSKVSYLLATYAWMVARPFRRELSALAGAFARLYDDFLDETDSGDLGSRLTGLFQDGRFTPRTDLEHLLFELYQAIDHRLTEDQRDPVYKAIIALHEHQLLSVGQKDPGISPAALASVTSAKGRFANLVLFALMKPGMDAGEQELVMEMGEILQLMDDYRDIELDRCGGVTTLATMGQLPLAAVSSRLCRLDTGLRTRYGRRARRFGGVLYVLLVSAFLGRYYPRRPHRARPVEAEPERAGIRLLRQRTHNAIPPATAAPPASGAGDKSAVVERTVAERTAGNNPH